jgi:hypothetical protein
MCLETNVGQFHGSNVKLQPDTTNVFISHHKFFEGPHVTLNDLNP